MPPNTNSDNDEGTAPGAVGHARIKVLLYRKSNRELGAAACRRKKDYKISKKILQTALFLCIIL